MSKHLICLCNLVTENEIRTALKRGARSTKDIQRMTKAGTSCGRCLVIIDDMVETYLDHLPVDPQQCIDFSDN